MKPDQQMQILDKFQARMRAIITSKREDYANTDDVLINFKRAGFAAGGDASINILNLMGTKIARAAELCKGKEPNHESLDDTILDLANYCFLLYCVRNDNECSMDHINEQLRDLAQAKHFNYKEFADDVDRNGAELTADGFVIGGGRKFERISSIVTDEKRPLKPASDLSGRSYPIQAPEQKPFNERKMEANKPEPDQCFPVDTVEYWLNKIENPKVRAAALRNAWGDNRYKKANSISDAIATGWHWSMRPFSQFWAQLFNYYLRDGAHHPAIPDDL